MCKFVENCFLICRRLVFSCLHLYLKEEKVCSYLQSLYYSLEILGHLPGPHRIFPIFPQKYQFFKRKIFLCLFERASHLPFSIEKLKTLYIYLKIEISH